MKKMIWNKKTKFSVGLGSLLILAGGLTATLFLTTSNKHSNSAKPAIVKPVNSINWTKVTSNTNWTKATSATKISNTPASIFSAKEYGNLMDAPIFKMRVDEVIHINLDMKNNYDWQILGSFIKLNNLNVSSTTQNQLIKFNPNLFVVETYQGNTLHLLMISPDQMQFLDLTTNGNNLSFDNKNSFTGNTPKNI